VLQQILVRGPHLRWYSGRRQVVAGPAATVAASAKCQRRRVLTIVTGKTPIHELQTIAITLQTLPVLCAQRCQRLCTLKRCHEREARASHRVGDQVVLRTILEETQCILARAAGTNLLRLRLRSLFGRHGRRD